MRIASIVLVGVLTAVTAGAQERPADRLRRAIVEEEANQDADKAIRGYRQIVKDYDEARQAAGTALFRLAESCRKAGQKEEAERLYRRVVREFADDYDLVRASRQHLPAPAAAAAESSADGRSDASESRATAIRAEREVEYARRKVELASFSTECRLLEERMRTERQKVAVGVEAPSSDAMIFLQRQVGECQARLAEANVRIRQLEAWLATAPRR